MHIEDVIQLAADMLEVPVTELDEELVTRLKNVNRIALASHLKTVDWPEIPKSRNLDVAVRDLEAEVRKELVGECPFRR